jgi:hypothetical protein
MSVRSTRGQWRCIKKTSLPSGPHLFSVLEAIEPYNQEKGAFAGKVSAVDGFLSAFKALSAF